MCFSAPLSFFEAFPGGKPAAAAYDALGLARNARAERVSSEILYALHRRLKG
jgi:hypothetical protein